MRYKIVGDSCCDLTAEDLKKEYYVSVPLTLTVVFYILKDYLIGLLPIIGDIADIFYTSNTYILRTIEGYVAGDKETVHKVNSSAVKCAIGIVVLGIAIYYAIQLVAYILSAIFG